MSGGKRVLDDGWASRLKISRPDFGIGMSMAEVATLSAAVDVAALRDHRDAVGRCTREIIGAYA